MWVACRYRRVPETSDDIIGSSVRVSVGPRGLAPRQDLAPLQDLAPRRDPSTEISCVISVEAYCFLSLSFCMPCRLRYDEIWGEEQSLAYTSLYMSYASASEHVGPLEPIDAWMKKHTTHFIPFLWPKYSSTSCCVITDTIYTIISVPCLSPRSQVWALCVRLIAACCNSLRSEVNRVWVLCPQAFWLMVPRGPASIL